MSKIKCFIIALFLTIVLSVSAQSMVEAGSNQTIYCTGSVQLNATPLNGWGNLTTSSLIYVNSIYFTTNEVGYTAGNTGVIMKTIDGGASWTTYSGSFGSTSLYAVYFINANTGFITGSGGLILKTTNAGATWSQQTSGSTEQLRSIYFTSPTTGYIAGAGAVLKTTDGGTTWTRINVGNTTQFYSVFFTSSTTGFMSGASGLVMKTVDAGLSWAPLSVTTGTPVLYSIHFPTSTTGFITGSTGAIFKTIDGGTSWNKYTADSVFKETESVAIKGTGRSLKLAYLNSVYFTSAANGYIAGSYGSGSIFLKTTDGGTSWVEQSSNASTKMTCVYFPSENIGYAGGGGGKVLKLVQEPIKTLSYSWIPEEGLSNPFIANPVANPSISTKYRVSATDGSNIYSDTVTVGVLPMSVTMPAIRSIGCEGGVKLDSVIVKYTGLDKLKYKWTPATGLSSDTVANPIATFSGDMYYTLTVSAGACSATATTYVSQVPLVVLPTVDRSLVCRGTVQLSAKTNYSGKASMHYKWTPSTGLNNDTIANPTATISSSLAGSRVYTVTATTTTGCSAQNSVDVRVNSFAVSAGSDLTIACGGSVQLNGVSTNYVGTGRLRYKWTPSTGLSSDTIINPIASPITQTVYDLMVTTPEGCSTSDQVIVSVTPITANAGSDKTINCGGTAQLDAVTTNYTGTGRLRYKWSPATGLNNDTIANPLSKPSQTTTYTVTVTSPNGCSASDNVVVTLNPLTVNVGDDKTAKCGTNVQLGVVSTNYIFAPPLRYKWTPATGLNNDTIASPVAIVSNSITYTLTITTSTGCTASDNVVISIIPLDKPVINTVTVNSKNKYEISWTKPLVGKVNVYNVYKETNATNVYSKIGLVGGGALPVFVDTLSKPEVQSAKYKISTLDDCGNETLLSDYHKTMHMYIYKVGNSVWNLMWEPYEGFTVSTYNIYRGTTANNLQIIGSLSGSNTQFSDYTAPTGYIYYQVEALSGLYTSRTNIATNKNGTDGLFDLKDISDKLSVFPNPATGSTQLIIADGQIGNTQLHIYNAMGRLVQKQELISNKQQIDISKLSNGLYFMVVMADKFVGTRKLLIQN